MVKFKDKERNLQATRDKKEVTCKGATIKLAADCATETHKPERNDKKYCQL